MAPQRGWRCLLLGAAAAFWLGGPPGTGSSHSLLYFRTCISQPGSGLTGYLEVGYLDGRPIERYDSHTGRMVPLAPWMNQSVQVMESYWEIQATLASLNQEGFGHYLRILQNDLLPRRNSSRSPDAGREPNSCSSSEFECGDRTCIPWRYICDWSLDCQDGSDEDSALCTPQGFHTLQCIDGCELGDDGQENSFHREAYDGREIQKWEATWDLYRQRKSFWGRNCTGWLKRHLPYLEEEELRRKEPPAVRVTRVGTSQSLETLACRADGFYPKEINVSWVKDGQVFLQETLRKGALPNADGTFQAQLSLQIDPKERGHYRCHVEHAGLQGPLDVGWEGPGSAWPLVGGVLGTGAALLLLAGMVCYSLRTRPSASKATSESASVPNEAAEISQGRGGEESPPKELEEIKLMDKGEPSTLSAHRDKTE
ncbi:major histocompatibility complex class I-related protein 1-like isoform X2 [Pogona vitticeps]